MPHKLVGILSLLVCSFLFAVPASAANIPACGPNFDGTNDFTLVGQDQTIFEGSDTPKVIQGNVLVTGPNGLLKIGKNIIITGTATANRIEFHSSGTSRVEQKCVANVITGPLGGSDPTCAAHGANGEFDAFEAAHPNCVNPAAFSSLCGATPVANACVNGAPNLTVAVGTTTNLPADNPGVTCYKDLVLETGAVLNLTGTFNFKTIRMKSGSQLNGVGGQATVNVNGQFITEPGVFITKINLNSSFSTGDVIAIFNNSILTGVVINAPFGRCHPHTGTALKDCSEICCKTLDVEPVTAECQPGSDVCSCPDGFVFQEPSTPANDLARVCVPKP